MSGVSSVGTARQWSQSGRINPLAALPVKPALVNVFRLPTAIPAIVDEMLALGLKNLWVQLGIVNLDAAKHAEAGGIRVVMDRCIMVEHRRRQL